MPKIETWQCAGCGRLKGETNNWWVAGNITKEGFFYLMPMSSKHEVYGEPYEEDSYCSAECLLKRLSKYMETAHAKV